MLALPIRTFRYQFTTNYSKYSLARNICMCLYAVVYSIGKHKSNLQTFFLLILLRTPWSGVDNETFFLKGRKQKALDVCFTNA